MLILPDLHDPFCFDLQKQSCWRSGIRVLMDRFDWVVLLGDMTCCYGTPREYEQVGVFINALGRPYCVVNGQS